MRGIVVGIVLSLILWVFIVWCGVCVCQWLGITASSATALALVTSLACIVGAALAGAVWIAALGEDEIVDDVSRDLALSE